MAKGRPVDPRRAKRGTGHHPVPAERGPQLPASAGEVEATPPAELPESVHEVWRACVCELTAGRPLHEPDLVLLRAYCEAVYVHLAASAQIHAAGVLVPGAMGVPAANPMIRVQKDAAATIRQLSDALGLGPLARIRAGVMEVAGQTLALDLRDRLMRKVRGQE